MGLSVKLEENSVVLQEKTHKQNEKHTRAVDISGQRFGMLKALYPTPKRDSKGFIIWHCLCDCGSQTDVSYNALVHSKQQSCGCRKKQHEEKLHTFLTFVDGTNIDTLKSKKVPANNTTGTKGVYLIRGKYVAKIVFQKKQYILGSYANIEDAAAARINAEKQLNDAVVGYYEKWSQRAENDPAWVENNPVRISVDKKYGEIQVIFEPSIDDITAEYKK